MKEYILVFLCVVLSSWILFESHWSIVPTIFVQANTKTSILSRWIEPSQADSSIQKWNEPHYVCISDSSNQKTDTLWIFLPGTGATPDYYTVLTNEAAKSGLHAICLRYPNYRSHEKTRKEIVTGEDVTDNVTVDAENSIEGRIKSLLQYLRETYPQEKWEQYLDSKDQIVWPKIVISGHSQGAGHALYIAKNHQVHHCVSFAGIDVRKGSLASWLRNGNFLTPPEDFYLFWHKGDTMIAKHQPALMKAIGVEPFGNPVVVDSLNPPYKGSHGLNATTPPPAGELAHNTHVADKALRYDDNGIPIYRDVWQFLFQPQTKE
jgi:hypothetical protein